MNAPSLLGRARHDWPRRAAYQGRDLGPEELDRAQRLLVRERADADLRQEAVVAEELVLEEDLLGNLLGASDGERAARRAELVELGPTDRRPAALAADGVHHRGVGGEELVGGSLGRLGDVRVRVDAERRRRVVTGLARRLPVQLRERDEALGHPADDREHHRQPQRPRAHRRLGRAADGHPDRQPLLRRPRVDALVVERGAVPPGPGHPLRLA